MASAIGWLHARRLPFVVLANFHIGGRQIDCAIAAANTVLVVEVKSSFLPVLGEINGTWSRLHASGQWLPYGNAYEQALKAKNALRDVMASVKEVGTFYPDGHVVFTSGLPSGSQLTRGDYKVGVQTLDEFMAGLVLQGASPWTLDDWRRLASNLSLTSVTMDEIIAPRDLRLAHEIVRHYCATAATEYGGAARRWLSESTEQQTALFSAATSGPGCFISGPLVAARP
ncbi:MAG: nuclease-related domain-containing protein [Gammaproteobacteria bacterium]